MGAVVVVVLVVVGAAALYLLRDKPEGPPAADTLPPATTGRLAALHRLRPYIGTPALVGAGAVVALLINDTPLDSAVVLGFYAWLFWPRSAGAPDRAPVWALRVVVLAVGFRLAREREASRPPRPLYEQPARSAPHAPPAPPVDVSPSALMAEYLNNEVAADAAYKGRRVRLSGSVMRIGKTFLGGAYITLSAAAAGETIRTVQVEMMPEQLPRIARLMPGSQVTVTGECVGMMMNVQVRDGTFE